MQKKLPDSYVQKRNLKEYPTEVGSHKFSPQNIDHFKSEHISKLEKHYSSRIKELEDEYLKIIDEIRLNERIYSAKCSFEPIPGNIYHLYEKDDKEFISILSPSEWNMNYLGTYKFLSDGRWINFK